MTAALDAGARAAVGELATAHGLPEVAEARLAELAAALSFESDAPTSLRDPGAVVRQHLADSLVALELDEVREARRIVDIGSGAGPPGIVLAIARPDAAVALLEANARKCAFLGRLIGRCGLENATVVNARAETWPAGLGRFDLATARALAPLEVVAEYAAPLLVVGGTLIAWRGRREPESERAADRAAPRLGLEVGEVRSVVPFSGAENRHLHLMSKVVETPSAFPRRAGIALKRPLGRSGREP